MLKASNLDSDGKRVNEIDIPPEGLSWCSGTAWRWSPVAFLRFLVEGQLT